MPKVTDEHRAARREQILSAAFRCVGREGFHRTTMADVISEAGLSAGAVYSYFKSKKDIIRAIAEYAIGSIAGVLHELVEREQAVHPADALRTVIEHIVGLAEHPEGDLTRVGVQAWAEAVRDPDIHAVAKEAMGQVRSALEDVVRRSQADGTVPKDADPAAVAQVLFGLIPGFVLQRLILEDITAESYISGLRALVAGAD